MKSLLFLFQWFNFVKTLIQAEFEKFGEVVDTYNTGKGYAFVTFGAREHAKVATEEMNGTTVFGQEIKASSEGERDRQSENT